MFLEGRFFLPQLWGWLAGVVFIDHQNSSKSKLFSSFRINFTCFWKVDFFYPQLWGWLAGVVFVDNQNSSKSKLFSSFRINLTCFWKVDFFQPQLWGWIARVVFVDQQNGWKGMCFSSFRINFTWFWRVGFFSSGGSFELWPESNAHSRVYERSTTCSDRFGGNLGVTGCALSLLA